VRGIENKKSLTGPKKVQKQRRNGMAGEEENNPRLQVEVVVKKEPRRFA